ncbi:MAG: hypothetical protein M9928_07830 [Anaerolineae bacterium]|nr:hypothetical protein [Anaerolineae bacterium]MCO5204924.1 hypothetical protein [Anaerolineae bacterium]
MKSDQVMYTFTWDGEPPTVAEVCERYGWRPEEIDAAFGVIAIDPQDNLYTILVNRDAVQRLDQTWETAVDDDLTGPFSNPPISPFGPPEP